MDGLERSFAAFYATTRDFARFGKLLLQGRVETQVLSEDVKDMVTPIYDDELGVELDTKSGSIQTMVWTS